MGYLTFAASTCFKSYGLGGVVSAGGVGALHDEVISRVRREGLQEKRPPPRQKIEHDGIIEDLGGGVELRRVCDGAGAHAVLVVERDVPVQDHRVAQRLVHLQER